MASFILSSSSLEPAQFSSHFHIEKPLIGKSKHHLINAKALDDNNKTLTLDKDEIRISHDVVALFLHIPVDEAQDIIATRLRNDPTLHKQTCFFPAEIMEFYVWWWKQAFPPSVEIYTNSPQVFPWAASSSEECATLSVKSLRKRLFKTAPMISTLNLSPVRE